MMFVAFLCLVVTFALTGTAFAAVDNSSDLAGPMLEAIMSGDYIWAAAAGVVLGVAALRKFTRFKSGKSAAVMVVLGSFAGAVLSALTAGGALSFALVLTALKVAIFSGGGVALSKELAPSWLRPVLDRLLGSDKIADAEKAGQDAVEASPSQGEPTIWQDVE